MLIGFKVKSLIGFWSLWQATILSILSSYGSLAAHMFDVYCFDQLSNVVTVELIFRVFFLRFRCTNTNLSLANDGDADFLRQSHNSMWSYGERTNFASQNRSQWNGYDEKFLRIHSYDDEYVSAIPIRYHTQQQRICLWCTFIWIYKSYWLTQRHRPQFVNQQVYGFGIMCGKSIRSGLFLSPSLSLSVVCSAANSGS